MSEKDIPTSTFLNSAKFVCIRTVSSSVIILLLIPFMPPSFLRYDEGRQSGLYLLPPPAAFSSSESI